jgi:hypothetical protein
MNNCDYKLELSDGTTVRIGSLGDSQLPDIKAFYLPPGSLQPFSSKNLPTARQELESPQRSCTSSA